MMTSDYARHSPFLSRHAHKLHEIPVLIDSGQPNPTITRQIEERWHLNGHQRVGFAARFAAEKGVEYLLRALPQVLDAFPDARIIFTGAYKNTIGEDAYRERLEPLLRAHADRLTFLDLLAPSAMPSYFGLCDVLAVTSINSTESFGLVQAEAMLAGTPVVATDLPGVREAVQRTGMGLGYLTMALAFNVVFRVYLVRDLWAKVAETSVVYNIAAADNVAVFGDAASAIGEGFADSLDIGGF